MPNYRRARADGATYFFTLALAERGRDTLTRHIGALRHAMAETFRDHPCSLDAAVVLPDHLHLVLTMPEGRSDFSTIIGAMKARFTRRMRQVGWNPALPVRPSLVRKGEAGVWQRRFWEHLIRDDADYCAHVTYCWANPVKHGLVARPADWPFSSLHRDIRRGLVPPEWQERTPEIDAGE
ncbi:MAG: transposase [Pseudomonadota bacterium]